MYDNREGEIAILEAQKESAEVGAKEYFTELETLRIVRDVNVAKLSEMTNNHAETAEKHNIYRSQNKKLVKEIKASQEQVQDMNKARHTLIVDLA